MFNSDSARWRALQTRDKSAHSSFVYAVITTRIVCRPTCPSRLARRANVKYYNTAIEASLEGYRPCKRCEPDVPEQLEIDKATLTVTQACKIIHAHDGRIKLTELAQRTGYTTRHLHNLFKASMGCTPLAYASRLRQLSEEARSVDSEQTSPAISNMANCIWPKDFWSEPFDFASICMSDNI